MDFMDLFNIRGNDIEKCIKDAISITSSYYKDLTREATCYIYSSMIFECLKEKGVTARIVDTSSFGDFYSHRFVLVPCTSDSYYLVDLTYEQFIKDDKYIKKLYDDGYVLLTDDLFKEYLSVICDGFKFDIDDVFYSKKK